MNNAFLQRAMPLVELGYYVFPLAANSKLPAISKKLGGQGFKDATLDVDLLHTWAKRYPNANVGIATGYTYGGLYVVDEDRHKGAHAGPLQLPPTLMSITGREGYHYWFRVDRELPCTENKLGPAIDTRGDGGYIVGPGSVVPEGAYRFHPANWEVCGALALPALPSRLVMDIQAPEPATMDAPRRDPVAHTDAGAYWLDWAMSKTGDGYGDKVGFLLAQQLLVEEKTGARVDVRGVLMSYAIQATRNPMDPFDADSVDRWIASAQHSDIVAIGERARSQTPRMSNHTGPTPTATPRASQTRTEGTSAKQPEEERQMDPIDSSQFGLARLLLQRHGADMRYNGAWGFITWDGIRWRRKTDLVVQQWAMELIEELCRTAEPKDDGKPADVHKRRTEATIAAVMKLVRPYCHVDLERFDTHPFLFNVQNGTLDLKTGKLRDHDKADYITQVCPLHYDAGATCERFGRFVEEIMVGREDLVMYLQRFLGYCLTGDVAEQVWHLAVGRGANGKSTLFELVARVMGEYAGTLEPEAICQSSRMGDPNAPSPAMAGLAGKRFVRVTETEDGARIAAARIKRMSGGDTLSGRFLHRDIFEYWPQFKLAIYTNHKPAARETGHAFWRRVRMIPFDFKYVATGKPVEELKETLWREEAQGILAWLVRGAATWAKIGLAAPREVMEATAQYERESDTLGLFLEERTEVSEACIPVRSAALYLAYQEWCDDAGEKNALSLRRFSIALGERGYRKREDRDANVWVDLRLKDRSGMR